MSWCTQLIIQLWEDGVKPLTRFDSYMPDWQQSLGGLGWVTRWLTKQRTSCLIRTCRKSEQCCTLKCMVSCQQMFKQRNILCVSLKALDESSRENKLGIKKSLVHALHKCWIRRRWWGAIMVLRCCKRCNKKTFTLYHLVRRSHINVNAYNKPGQLYR